MKIGEKILVGAAGTVLFVGGIKNIDVINDNVGEIAQHEREQEVAEHLKKVLGKNDLYITEVAGEAGRLIIANVEFDNGSCRVQYEADPGREESVDLVGLDLGTCALVGTQG